MTPRPHRCLFRKTPCVARVRTIRKVVKGSDSSESTFLARTPPEEPLVELGYDPAVLQPWPLELTAPFEDTTPDSVPWWTDSPPSLAPLPDESQLQLQPVTRQQEQEEEESAAKRKRWVYRIAGLYGSVGDIREKKILAAFPDFPLFQAFQQEANVMFDLFRNPRQPTLDKALVDAGALRYLRQKAGDMPITKVSDSL